MQSIRVTVPEEMDDAYGVYDRHALSGHRERRGAKGRVRDKRFVGYDEVD